jgi:hypothetical protein
MSRWRHKNRGTVYEIITTTALMQCATRADIEQMFEKDMFTVYKSIETGQIWLRPTAEFMDGRFEQIDA